MTKAQERALLAIGGRIPEQIESIHHKTLKALMRKKLIHVFRDAPVVALTESGKQEIRRIREDDLIRADRGRCHESNAVDPFLVPVVCISQGTPPHADAKCIRFNGVGELEHEDFDRVQRSRLGYEVPMIEDISELTIAEFADLLARAAVLASHDSVPEMKGHELARYFAYTWRPQHERALRNAFTAAAVAIADCPGR